MRDKKKIISTFLEKVKLQEKITQKFQNQQKKTHSRDRQMSTETIHHHSSHHIVHRERDSDRT